MAGSVTKRGNVYYIRYDLPRGPNGKRRQKKLACPRLNKRQAQEKLQETIALIRNGGYVEPSGQTLGAYLRKWLDYAQQQLATRTHERYAELVSKHIVPALGNVPLEKLRPGHVQEYYGWALRSGRLDGKGGLSPRTVNHIHGILHSALKQAVRWQITRSNPADAVSPPRIPASEVRTASAPELAQMIVVVKECKWRMPILIVIATGMRRGEVAGLQWRDFDPAKRTMIVRRAVVQTSRGLEVKEPKTGRGRVILVPAYLVGELQTYREQQAARLATTGKPQRDETWITDDGTGGLVKPRWIGDQFADLARKSGVDVTLHGLRHTQATILITSGVPVKVVSERLGHSRIDITQDIYSHILPHMQERAVEVLDGLLPSPAANDGAQTVPKEAVPG